MNAEEILIYLKECVDMLKDDKIETHILPTKEDPTELQNNVSFIIFEKVKGGMIPKLSVNVNTFDNEQTPSRT